MILPVLRVLAGISGRTLGTALSYGLRVLCPASDARVRAAETCDDFAPPWVTFVDSRTDGFTSTPSATRREAQTWDGEPTAKQDAVRRGAQGAYACSDDDRKTAVPFTGRVLLNPYSPPLTPDELVAVRQLIGARLDAEDRAACESQVRADGFGGDNGETERNKYLGPYTAALTWSSDPPVIACPNCHHQMQVTGSFFPTASVAPVPPGPPASSADAAAERPVSLDASAGGTGHLTRMCAGGILDLYCTKPEGHPGKCGYARTSWDDDTSVAPDTRLPGSDDATGGPALEPPPATGAGQPNHLEQLEADAAGLRALEDDGRLFFPFIDHDHDK